MLKVGNREHLLGPAQQQQARMMLVQLLLAFLYDWRTMDFEPSCESAWTVNKLCAFLAGFVHFETLEETILSFYRRCMIYPIYRNFKLVEKVHSDLVVLLTQLPRVIPISMICMIMRLFSKSEPRYLLNILYIEDLVVFCQTVEQEEYIELGKQIAKIKITKEKIDLDLEDLEKEGFSLETD